MRYIILLAGLMIMVTVAHGGIFQWTESDGGVHFTDNPDKIPPDFRHKARAVDVTPSIQVPEQAPEASTPAPQALTSSYGGHNETWWRSSFNTLREKINGIQDGLPEKKKRLAELRRQRTIYTRTRDRIAYNQLDGEIKRNEEQVLNLQKQLADLDEKAASAGVPMEWRK
jgi:hypothetical protein